MSVVVHNSFNLSNANWHSSVHSISFFFVEAFSPEIRTFSGLVILA